MRTGEIEQIALREHAGQVDKAGRDYFDAHLTPIAEAAAVFGPSAEAAGWLHDIIEDTDVTGERLAQWGVEQEVIDAVLSVSRRSDETYKELIGRTAAHPLGRLVKLVDNSWNIASNPGLAELDPEKAASMLRRRYLPACARLLKAAGLTEQSADVNAVQAILDKHLQRLSGR